MKINKDVSSSMVDTGKDEIRGIERETEGEKKKRECEREGD